MARGHRRLMEPPEPEEDPVELPPRLPVHQHVPRLGIGGIVGVVLAAVLVVGGLFVIAMAVLITVGLNGWASNK